MGLGSFFGDIVKRVISNLLVFVFMAILIILAVRFVFGVNILSLFFG